eukprot:16056961-Heterocapsa_arctica.AAC.1
MVNTCAVPTGLGLPASASGCPEVLPCCRRDGTPAASPGSSRLPFLVRFLHPTLLLPSLGHAAILLPSSRPLAVR